MVDHKRTREYQNKLIKVKQKYLEDETKRREVKNQAERCLQDLKHFEDFRCDLTTLPQETYYNCLIAARTDSQSKLVEVFINYIVEFLDGVKEKQERERVESAMNKYIMMYFPDGCCGYNEDLDDLIKKAPQLQLGMNFNTLENILKCVDDDDPWELVAKHLKSTITKEDAVRKHGDDKLKQKCYVFINLVPKQIPLKKLFGELLFALSEYCECKVNSISELDNILQKAIEDQNAEYFD